MLPHIEIVYRDHTIDYSDVTAHHTGAVLARPLWGSGGKGLEKGKGSRKLFLGS